MREGLVHGSSAYRERNLRSFGFGEKLLWVLSVVFENKKNICWMHWLEVIKDYNDGMLEYKKGM